MKKDGYLIARNRALKEFFTSSSAYDRPTWIAPLLATQYRTVELAESALKKLLRSGFYEARLVPADEAMSFEMPDDKEAVTLPSDEERQDLEANGGDPQDLETEAPGDAEQMVAGEDGTGEDDDTTEDNQDDNDEEMNTDIQAQVDSKLGNDASAGSDMPTDEIDPNAPPVDSVDGEMPVDGEEDHGPLIGDENEDDPQQALRNPQMHEGMVGMKDIPVVSFRNDLTDKEPEQTPVPKKEKITVPAGVMSDLRAAIADYQKQAKFANTRDDARATFALTVAAAFEELAELLAQGDEDGMKWAQIKMTSWMNPITANLPVSVQKFIQMGGRKPSLKNLFDSTRKSK